MANELRKTGISIVGDIPWGTHFCCFYETAQDLLDILVPYFKAGLENHEFCLCIASEPVIAEEAQWALREAVPNFQRYLAEGQIEIVSHLHWYLTDDSFDPLRVRQRWIVKLEQALARGYAGMRFAANIFWLEKQDWDSFADYEGKLDEVFGKLRIMAICTYSLARCSAADMLDVVHHHQFSVARRHGAWQRLEGPELQRAHAEIRKLNADLERQVEERTAQFTAANEQLTGEIAERKQAEDRLRLVIDTIPAMVFTALPNGSVDYVNQRWLHYMGLSLEDVLAWNWDVTIHPEDRASSIDHWRSTMAAGQSAENELRVRRADGVYRWILGRFVPLRDEVGNIVKWYGVSTDIDDRKRAEQALRASEARLQAAIDAADIGLWDWDLVSGQIIWLGHHDKLFGFAPGEFDGTYPSFEKRVHPQDLEELNSVVQRAREEGSDYAHEYRVIWPDGSIHWIAGRGRFVYNETGQPVRMYGAVLDITQRKQAEEALRQSAFDLAEAQRVARLGSWSFDIATNAIRWSDELYRIFDVEKTAFDGVYESFLSRVHPNDRTRVLQLNAEARSSGEPFEVEYRITTRSGQLKHIREIGYARKDSTGAVSGLFGTAQDITERKQAEAAIRSLLQISEKLHATLDIDALLDSLVIEAMELIDAEMGWSGLRTEEGMVCHTHITRDLQVVPFEYFWPPGIGLPGWVLVHKVPYVMNDAQSDTVIIPEIRERFGVNAAIDTPILDAQGEVIGFFEVNNKKNGAGFSESDVEKLVAVSRIASIALQNAMSYRNLERAEKALRESQLHLQLLSRQLLQAQEAERRSVARELHDEIGQQLTGLGLLLSSQHASPDQLAVAQAVVRDLIAQVRSLALDLRPAMLDDLGLVPALVWLFERYTAQTQVAVQFEHAGLEEQRFAPEVETSAYRIVQEALTNVARHAGVSEVTLRLWTDADTLSVIIVDQGRGFDLQAVRTTLSSGLAGMAERAALLGGSLTIESTPATGTRVTASLPLHSDGEPRGQEHDA